MARLHLAAPVSAFIVLFVACIGDDPAVLSGPGPSLDASAEGSTFEGGPGTCAGTAVEACGDSCAPCATPKDGHAECKDRKCQSVCDPGKTLCGDACVETKVSKDHCGACGHSCEGGDCLAGVCQPVVMVSGLTDTHALDVSATYGVFVAADKNIVRCDAAAGCTSATLKPVATGFDRLTDMVVSGNEVYFNSGMGDYSRIARCDLAGAGCPAPAAIDPNLVDDIVNREIVRLVTAAPNRLLWSVRGFNGPYIKACTLPGCAAASQVTVRQEQAMNNAAISDTTNPVIALAASTNRVLYGSSVYGVGGVATRSCAFGAACTDPTNVGVASGAGSAISIAFFNGKFYVATKNGSSDSLWTNDDGTLTLTSVGSDLSGITDIAVDASGTYWTNGTTGKILKGAAGGGMELASGQAGAKRIRVDAKFIYWMTDSAVMRLVK